MTPEDLEEILDLEYQYRLSPRKVFRITCAVLSLNAGIMLAAHGGTSLSRIIGVGCLTFFIWLGFGDPFDQVLTPESIDKVRRWLNNVDDK